MSTAEAKVALVTGAARGIGLATAKRFLADGWNVALLDIDEATLNRTQRRLPAPAHPLPFTATSPSAPKSWTPLRGRAAVRPARRAGQ